MATERKRKEGWGERETPWTDLWEVRADDVGAPLVTVAELQRKCDDRAAQSAPSAAPLRLVVQVGEDEAYLATALAAQHAFLHLLTIRPLMPEGHLLAGESRRDMPGRVRGRNQIRLRSVALRQYGDNAPALAVQSAALPAKTTVMTTTVLRLHAEERYAPGTWKRVCQAPGAQARHWARALLDSDQFGKLRDTFKPQLAEDGKSLTLLWRVEDSVLDDMIGLSGRQCAGRHRFFVEPGRWLPPAPPPCSVDFSYRRQHDESWEQYADRVVAHAGPLGVARGERSLGVRRARGADAPRKRMWHIDRVPASHTQADVAGLCRTAGLADVEFISSEAVERPAGSALMRRKWVVRATAPDDRSWFEHRQEVAGETVDIVGLVASLRPRSSKGSAMAREKSINLRPQTDERKAPTTAVPAPAGRRVEEARSRSDVGAAPAEGRRPDSQEQPAGKRAAVAAAPPLPGKPDWAETQANAGGGDSVPLALAAGHLRSGGVRVSAGQVRAEIIAHLSRYRKDYEPYWDSLAPGEKDRPLKDFSAYLEAAAKPGAWLGGLALTAASERADRPILVHRTGAPPQVYARAGPKPPIRLWYTGKHYELIVTKPPQLDLTTAIQGGCRGGRGGALCRRV